jgi:hypothetical protein
MLDPVPRRYTVCSHLFLPRCHRPSPSEEWVGFPRFVPRITTSRRPVFRGCRYSLMFRPPSLLSPQIVPTAAILPQGSRGFYVRAYRALLPPHAPDMLTVRVQVIDGTGTFTLSDSQPCRLLTSLRGHYPASSLLRSSPPLGSASVLSASRLEPLVRFPLTSPTRFSSSARKPETESRLLNTGHHMDSK